MKVLVVIANFGRANQAYLLRVLHEYRGMPYDLDIVVTSDIAKDFEPDIKVIVGLPNAQSWSLPFAHKKIMADRHKDYDLFIYSEDDILITKEHIESFLKATEILGQDEIAGFLRFETDEFGEVHYIDAHSHYHWIPGSVRLRDNQTFGFFTNEHAGMYMLTREQLRKAIESGGFLVEPHQETYHLPETAATDPYTQCGFKKMICLSRLEDFSVAHLPNKKHGGRPYSAKSEFRHQIETLLEIQKNGHWKGKLFEANPRVGQGKWSKSYYEPFDPFSDPQAILDIRPHVPLTARSVLSIGCGWGAAEAELVRNGTRVVGVAIDSVIAACAAAKGIEVVCGGFSGARQKLEGESFDCILLSYVLHLVPEPAQVLSSFAELLSPGGTIIISAPNLSWPVILWKRMSRDQKYQHFGKYEQSGIHLTDKRSISRWLQNCGLKIDKTVPIRARRAGSALRFWPWVGSKFAPTDLIAIATRR